MLSLSTPALRTVFFRWESIRRFPGVSVQRIFIFNVHTRTIFFLRRDHDPETRTAAAAAAVHRATNWLQRYNAIAPSSSRHHARVTDPRCTVSSCFGKHVRSVAHHIYSYQLFLGCCFCSASFGTKLRHSRTQQQRFKEHATTSIPIAPSSRQRHARVTDTRCARCTLSSCFVEPEVRHPSHTSNSLLDLCSAAEATS